MKGFALVGLGAISGVHARAISEARDIRLVGGYAPGAERRQAFAQAWCCRSYSSLQELLDDPEVDCVSICTPSGAHLDAILAALAAGKHVLVEKPLEITEKRCQRALEAAATAGLLLGGLFQSRFYDSSRLIKGAIEAGRFGRLSLVGAYVPWFRTQQYYDGSGWRGTWALDGGGAYMNQAIHMADLLRWLLGEPSSVCCRAGSFGHDRIEVEDSAVSILEWKGGPLGVLAATTAAYPGYFKRLEVSGMDGTAIMEEDRLVEWRFKEERPEDAGIRERFGVGVRSRLDAGRFEEEHAAHRKAYENFVAAVEGREPLAVTGEEALRSVHLVLDLYRSAGLRDQVD